MPAVPSCTQLLQLHAGARPTAPLLWVGVADSSPRMQPHVLSLAGPKPSAPGVLEAGIAGGQGWGCAGPGRQRGQLWVLQHLALPTPPIPIRPGKVETCQLPDCEPMAPQCPDTHMVMRQIVCACVRVREVSTASGLGQGMRHGVTLGKGTLRAGEEGLWELRGQGAATLPLSIGPVQGNILPLLPHWPGVPPGAKPRHKGRTPGPSHPCLMEEVVAAVVPSTDGLCLPHAHPHPAPHSGGLHCLRGCSQAARCRPRHQAPGRSQPCHGPAGTAALHSRGAWPGMLST